MASANGNSEPKEPFDICKWLSSLTSSRQESMIIFLGIIMLGISLWLSDLPFLEKFAITGGFILFVGWIKTISRN